MAYFATPLTKVYLVSYDLKGIFRANEPFYAELKQTGLWWHYLESTWLIATTESGAQLWNRLRAHLSPSDRIIVMEIVRREHHGWLPKEAWNWIAKHVPTT